MVHVPKFAAAPSVLKIWNGWINQRASLVRAILAATFHDPTTWERMRSGSVETKGSPNVSISLHNGPLIPQRTPLSILVTSGPLPFDLPERSA